MPLRNETPEEIQAYVTKLNVEIEKAAETLMSFEQQSAQQVGQALVEIERTIQKLHQSSSYEA